MDERRDVLGRRDRVLLMRGVPRWREREQLQGWQLLVERIPVLNRKGNVVIAAHVQDRNVRALERGKHGGGGEYGIARFVAKHCGGKLDGNGNAAVDLAPSDAICRLTSGCAA